MIDPIRAYLVNVLGITQWFSHHVGDVTPSVNAALDSALKILVYSPFQMSDEEKSMALKMLSSVQFYEPTFISQDILEDSTTQNLIEKQSWQYGISFGISPLQNIGRAWLELPSIAKFIDRADEATLTKHKRQAWSALLKFKSEQVTQ